MWSGLRAFRFGVAVAPESTLSRRLVFVLEDLGLGVQTEAINMRERYPGMRTKRCCEEASESSCLACCHSAEMGFSLDSLERLDNAGFAHVVRLGC